LAQEVWAKFEPRDDGRVWVGAGLRLKNLCGLASKAGLTGFEFLEGIPGNVGGALRMNAGAMGGWMFDVVEEVQLMTLAGDVKVLAKAAMHVDYRHCAELHHAIALGALLRPASQADAGAVARQIDVYRRKRQESQPREPSAGCIFKNPPGNSAGRLIDESGLKGERVGDAEVSTVHANFIVNRGTATGADVLELVRRVRARVRQVKGVELEPEVLLYGKNWRDVL
jgi:UDP-N-acetylenolpyruvoylglucosamine reductase